MISKLIQRQKSTGLVAFKKDHAKLMLFHDLTEKESERLANPLPKQPWACFSTPAQWDPFEDAHFEGKMGYVYTEGDRILSVALQRKFTKVAHVEKSTVIKASSHSPHLEMLDKLASIVISLAKEIALSKDPLH
jgi:hypothetical protein